MTPSTPDPHSGPGSAKARISGAKDELRDLLDEVNRLLSEVRSRHCTPTDERMASMVGDALARMPAAHARLVAAVSARVAEIEALRE